ncbi:MAG: hypothetical protein KGY69_09270 [Bacteroidales bacterium]|nr:hypothetical protein [Bacteroidales bacterium]
MMILSMVVLGSNGNPLSLARIGTYYQEGDPKGSRGYDGQFVYYIAKTPNPHQVEGKLDVPAYRYQRILLPIIAHYASFENQSLIPWLIPGLNLISHVIGTWGLAILLKQAGKNPLYALFYGLWAGGLLSLRLDLSEPLAFSLVILAVLAVKHGKEGIGWFLYGLAIFTKEVVVLFIIAQILAYLIDKKVRQAAGLLLISIIPYAIFQYWLKVQFGSFGLGSGGAMATGFEWIPLMGFFKIADSSILLFGIFLIVFGPFLLYPAVWGIWKSSKQIIKGQLDFEVIVLGLQGLSFLFLPFSTFREPGGLLRYGTGLIMTLILYIDEHEIPAFWKYAPAAWVLNLFLLEV